MIAEPVQTSEALKSKISKKGSRYTDDYFSQREKKKKKNKNIKNEVSVYLVDDDKFFLTGLHSFLNDSLSPKIKLKTFTTAADILDTIDEKPKIIVLDYILSSGSSKTLNGLSVLKKINLISPESYVIILSAQDSIDVAVEIINEGAYDYLSKNETAFFRLKNMINNLAETISANLEQTREELITKRINLFIILLLLLLFIIGRVIN